AFVLRRFLQRACATAERLVAKASRKRHTTAQSLRESLAKQDEVVALMEAVNSELHVYAPQGSPLSPFLSNVVLDELDKALENRGHRFCRYADDSHIYVRSARAGARGLASISRFITRRLQLKVHWRKSTVDRPWKRSFLGFSFTGGKASHTTDNRAEGTGALQSAGEST